jgi:hypothetical protein
MSIDLLSRLAVAGVALAVFAILAGTAGEPRLIALAAVPVAAIEYFLRRL